MPTTLLLSYTAHVSISVPNALAKAIKEDKDGKIKWSTKWGNFYWTDEKGEEHMIEGEEWPENYKHAKDEEWEEEEESEDEDDDDDENGSVCFRVAHEYNEKECSDNCPYKSVV
jgi:hypothetical protein